jgi:two-component system aerobic respiration control sensor histidine kinase ArcB
LSYFGQNKKILIVDNDSINTEFLKISLEENGFEAYVYNDPIKALSTFEPDVYDLCILGIRMPGLNGFELFRNIKQKDSKVKVCFTTSFEAYYQSLKEEHPKVDVSCFIRKTIASKDLIQLVKSELGVICLYISALTSILFMSSEI